MLKIKLCNLSIGGVVIRFYLAMAVAIILGFMGQWVLMAVIAGPIAATAIMGMSFSFADNKNATADVGKIIQLDLGEPQVRKAS